MNSVNGRPFQPELSVLTALRDGTRLEDLDGVGHTGDTMKHLIPNADYQLLMKDILGG